MRPGDTVLVNQPLVEVETAKAAVEVPSPYAGVVTVLHHPAGAMVDVGSAIISVDTDPDAGPDAGPLPPAARSSPPAGTGVGQSERTGAGRPVAAGAAAGGTAAGGATAAGATADGAAAHGATAAGTTADGAAATEAPGGRTAVLVGYGPRTGRRAARSAPPCAEPSCGVPAAARGHRRSGRCRPRRG